MALVVATAVTQQQKPNFTGVWVLAAPADAAARNPGQVEQITQTAETLTRGHDSDGGGHKLTYKLDGTETENRVAGMRIDSRATWEGSTLSLTDRAHTASGIIGKLTFTPKVNGDYEFSGRVRVRPLLSGVVRKLASPAGQGDWCRVRKVASPTAVAPFLRGRVLRRAA